MYNNEMEELPPIGQGRNSYACQYTFEDPFVYAIGGSMYSQYGKDITLDSVERFDIQNQKWTQMVALNTARKNPGTFVKDELLYAF